MHEISLLLFHLILLINGQPFVASTCICNYSHAKLSLCLPDRLVFYAFHIYIYHYRNDLNCAVCCAEMFRKVLHAVVVSAVRFGFLLRFVWI